eukprot:scaffold211741_cov22-Tisochrysis_lutea.AAC.1
MLRAMASDSFHGVHLVLGTAVRYGACAAAKSRLHVLLLLLRLPRLSAADQRCPRLGLRRALPLGETAGRRAHVPIICIHHLTLWPRSISKRLRAGCVGALCTCSCQSACRQAQLEYFCTKYCLYLELLPQ